MVDKKGNARIMDFGIARPLRTAGMTAAGMIIGTPEDRTPEQVEGREADQRTDLYALGAILFEMVTGRVLFEGDSPLVYERAGKVAKAKVQYEKFLSFWKDADPDQPEVDGAKARLAALK